MNPATVARLVESILNYLKMKNGEGTIYQCREAIAASFTFTDSDWQAAMYELSTPKVLILNGKFLELTPGFDFVAAMAKDPYFNAAKA